MSDTLFNALMGFFFLLMVWVVWHPRIHTGALGGLGCITMAFAALFSIDNSLYNSVKAVETCITTFVAGVTMVVVHVAVAVGRATHRMEECGELPEECPLRRRSDFQNLYTSSGDTKPMENANGQFH